MRVWSARLWGLSKLSAESTSKTMSSVSGDPVPPVQATFSGGWEWNVSTGLRASHRGTESRHTLVLERRKRDWENRQVILSRRTVWF